MGARGPKRTPTETLKARGSWLAKTRGDADGPLFPVDEPSCPDWLGREGKAEWRRVVTHLLSAGLLSEANRATLTAYCIAWNQLYEAEAVLKKEGMVLTRANGNKYRHPYLSIATAARADVVRLACEFGMTPASAGKVKPAKKDDVKETDDETQFFGTVG